MNRRKLNSILGIAVTFYIGLFFGSLMSWAIGYYICWTFCKVASVIIGVTALLKIIFLEYLRREINE